MKIAVVAGEPSGDYLGGELIRALSRRYPNAEFEGIGGEHMQAAGLTSLYPLEALSVMGVVEVIAHLPGLLRIRTALRKRWLHSPPDIFIGVDAPDFNLGVSRVLKAAGIKTVQYVSPTVWAWRPKRLKGLKRAVDQVLCIYPFEYQFFADEGMDAVFVGHPLADEIPLQTDHAAARSALGYSADTPLVALLPGSRRGEIDRLLPVFLQTAERLAAKDPSRRFVLPAATRALQALIEKRLAHMSGPPVDVIAGQARVALAAADAALVASGTATLEAMLLQCPSVMAYRVNRITAMLAKRSLTIPFFAMPNLMAGEMIMPEFVQTDARPERIAPAVERLLCTGADRALVAERFADLHAHLRRGASEHAAEAIADRLEGGGV